MGAYGVSTAAGGPYLNVSKVANLGIVVNPDVYADYMDTYQAGAGYVGEVAWIPQDNTPLITSGYNFVPSNIVSDYYMALSNNYS